MQMSIKAARVNKGLTQQELADEVKVAKKTVWSWENGKTKPTIDKIEPLCLALGVEYDDIRWAN